jgi:hypothetical protein
VGLKNTGQHGLAVRRGYWLGFVLFRKITDFKVYRNSMKMRLLISAVVLIFATAVRGAFPFAEATIDDLQAQMQAGKLTAHELLTSIELRPSIVPVLRFMR